jgi:rubrerythrin
MNIENLLRRCTRLEEAAARIYDTLAHRFRDDAELSHFWSGMAGDERLHAKKLALWRRLLRLSEKSSRKWDVAGYDEAVRDLDRMLRELGRAAEATTGIEEAFAIAIAVESSELDPIYVELLQASPLARFPDLADTCEVEGGEHHRALVAIVRARSKNEKNLTDAALIDASRD